jgi:CRISPR-associated protein Csd1
MQWKNDKIQSVCTNDSNWLPDFLCGPADEIFPAGVSGKRFYLHFKHIQSMRELGVRHRDYQRIYKLHFWRRLVFRARCEKADNSTIRAVANYIRSPQKLRFADLPLQAEGEEQRRLLESFEKGDEYISFRVNGRIAVSDPELKAWWEQQVSNQRSEVFNRLLTGRDAFLPDEGPITEYYPSVFGGVPFASFNAAPFVSYGLGSQTATFRLETAEKVAAALNSLLNDSTTSMQMGDETAVFWAVERTSGRQVSDDFMQLLDQPDPLAVQDYLRGIWGKRSPEIETADFHVAILLKGTGRFSVRSWHTDTLANADKHVRRYFKAIQLPEDEEHLPALRDLAWATIAKSKKQKTKPAPATYNALFEAAWRGTALPFDLLAATIERQRVELASGDADTSDFKARLAHRTALIQLYFALKTQDTEIPNWLKHVMNTKETAILCGRLLALLDAIHAEAHPKMSKNGYPIRDNHGLAVSASGSPPGARLYGAASATPALVFPRLCQLANIHLAKIGGPRADYLLKGIPKEKRSDGEQTDFEGLADIVAQLKTASGGDFPRLLSLEDQGRFALGYYYEKSRRWPFPEWDSQPANETNA